MHLVLYISLLSKIFENRNFDHWRIQEFIFWGGGGGKPKSPIENQERSPSREREAPENCGQILNKGKAGRGLGRGLGEPFPEKFKKIKLETIHFGAYLKQFVEMTIYQTNWLIAHFHEKSLVII